MKTDEEKKEARRLASARWRKNNPAKYEAKKRKMRARRKKLKALRALGIDPQPPIKNKWEPLALAKIEKQVREQWYIEKGFGI